MPIFLVRKRQSGTDAYGNDFTWQPEEWFVSAVDKNQLIADIEKINGVEIYANEFLSLRIDREIGSETKASSLRMYLSGYYISHQIFDVRIQ